jgi:ribosomal protein S18 acetylase RimI-like enzyme
MRGSGLGRHLMRQAEEEARSRSCRGVWLDTYSFQARGFYERLGFVVFGTIEDYPPGQRRIFMQDRTDYRDFVRCRTGRCCRWIVLGRRVSRRYQVLRYERGYRHGRLSIASGRIRKRRSRRQLSRKPS